MLTEIQRFNMLQRPSGRVDVVIDTDAYNEIDDQFAISFALAAEDKLCVQALYAAPFFNRRVASPAQGMERSYQEIHTLLHLANRAVPVFRGLANYLQNEKEPVVSEAAEDLAVRAMGYTSERPLYVVAIGAITNVASALLMQPDIAERIVLVYLGGHRLDWHDNREFNICQDVAAARVAFASGVPLVMLPCCGVVDAFTTTEPEMRYWLSGKNKLCDYLVDATVAEANTYAAGRVWSRPIWDVTAVGWLLDEKKTFMLDRLIPTPIPQYDDHWSESASRPMCRYVYSIRRDALMGELLRCVTYLSPNEHEAHQLTRLEITGEAALARCVGMIEAMGVGNVLITLGERGVAYDDGCGIMNSPAVNGLDVRDTTAAGDSFIGAFSVAVASGMPVRDALVFANHTAAITVCRMGAQPSLPTRKEVETLMQQKRIEVKSNVLF